VRGTLSHRLGDRAWALIRVRGLSTLVVATAGTAIAWVLARGADGPEAAMEGVAAVLNLLALVWGAAAVSGVVSHEVNRGVSLLWLQRPVHPVFLYLERFGERLLLALLATVVLAVLLSAALLPGGGAGRLFTSVLPQALAVVVISASSTFLLSAWKVQADAFAALAILVSWALLSGFLSSGGVGHGGGWVVPAVLATAPPLEALRGLGVALAGGDAGGTVSHGGRLAAYTMCLWALALPGLHISTARPFPRDQSR